MQKNTPKIMELPFNESLKTELQHKLQNEADIEAVISWITVNFYIIIFKKLIS